MLTESMEDYLEMVYRLVKEKGYIRAVDLSEALQFQASSITKMIQKLDEAGFIKYEKYRNIALTPLGEKYGSFLVWRDSTLKKFLLLLNAQAGIDEQVEGIEHYITPKTMQLISNLIIFFESNPQALQSFHALQQEQPDEQDDGFDQLRAWEFRHSMEA
ncbi:MAG: transcriptional regulator MntR [Bacillota bacterium]|nr:transcriptional regulator MntR [Bacillota bacterium]MDW7683741.1 transcriptional regulator MntR [Bacillota bacterium]